MRWLVTVVACVVALTSASCASARIRKENALALAAADARVLEGCYDCLRDARGTFERLAAGKQSKGSAGVVARLFETDVLIALREKELGLDSRGAMERARAFVPRLPSTSDLADRRKGNPTAAFNAASMNARLGNYARAAELLQVAAQSPDLVDQVEKLREELVQVPRRQ